MESETTFVAPEGVYTVIEEHKPSLLQTHAANTSSLSFPTRVSVISVKYSVAKDKLGFVGGGSQSLAQLLGGGGNKDSKKGVKEKEKEDGISLSSNDTPPDEQGEDSAGAPPASAMTTSSPFSQHSHASKKKPSAATKLSKPKHNMKTTSSTFITRTQNAEGFPRNLKDRDSEVTFLFYNQVKSVLWVEAGVKAKEPLSRITFSAFPTCHSINHLTASPERLDIVIGFNTGDLFWLDPISSRYNRLNKGGSISSSPCTAVRWVPGSASLFLVSHADGTIVVYDRDREDGVFSPQETPEDWDPTDSIFVTMPPWTWHPSPGGDVPAHIPDGDKSIKNPVSHWRVAPKGKAVVDFVFSPDVKYVGAISEDGCLRVIDALAETLIDCYASYFGAFTCLAWSPDGRFILTGGQDDLLTIFSPWEQRVVARCQGHSSFVSCVAFDEARCDTGYSGYGRTYRFGSVGEDNKLILWDFSSGALHRPKNQHTSHHHHLHSGRRSLSPAPGTYSYSTTSLAFRSPNPNPSSAGDGQDDIYDSGTSLKYHPAPSRNEIAVVQPVLVKYLSQTSAPITTAPSTALNSSSTSAATTATVTITAASPPVTSALTPSSSSNPTPDPLPTAIAFLPKHILTSTKNGLVKLWVRPLPAVSSSAKSAGLGRAGR